MILIAFTCTKHFICKCHLFRCRDNKQMTKNPSNTGGVIHNIIHNYAKSSYSTSIEGGFS